MYQNQFECRLAVFCINRIVNACYDLFRMGPPEKGCYQSAQFMPSIGKFINLGVQCTEVSFASFLPGGFITMAVINPA